MIDLRPVFMVVGILLVTLAATMVIPALIDFASGHPDWLVFGASSAVTMLAGGLLYFGNHCPRTSFNVRQAFLLTNLAWVVVSAFAALPFAFSQLELSYTDAYFEAMSGLTTTGATVIVGLDRAPPGILMWRALLNGLGGVGILVMAVAVMPFLRVGGMQLFRMESSDKTEKVLPKTGTMAAAIVTTYLGLAFLCAICLYTAGMGLFDAVAHALAAVSTGGFSTRDASLAAFDSPWIEGILMVFMISGALPLSFYVRVLQHNARRRALRDTQVRAFLKVLASCVLVMTLWLWSTRDIALLQALRLAAFNVTSIVTDTGFVSTDYSQWGHFAVAAFLLFTFIGGCTGSTAGGIKIFRWQILFRAIAGQVVWMFQPHRVLPLKYDGRAYGQDVVGSVVSFVVAYLLAYALLTVAMCLFGLDFLSGASAVAAAMANAGPGLGPVVGPAATYKGLPEAATWLLSFAMLLGRLEIFTIAVLFAPQFWRE